MWTIRAMDVRRPAFVFDFEEGVDMRIAEVFEGFRQGYLRF